MTEPIRKIWNSSLTKAKKPNSYEGMTQEELQAELERTKEEVRELGERIVSIRRKLEPHEKRHWKLLAKKWELEKLLAPVEVVMKGRKSSGKDEFPESVTPEELAAWKEHKETRGDSDDS